MSGYQANRRLAPDTVHSLLALLGRNANPSESNCSEVTRRLVEDFQPDAAQRVFPAELFRGRCRLFALEPALTERTRRTFYRASADAIIETMKTYASTADARAFAGNLQEMLARLDEDAAMLFRLAYIHGMRGELDQNGEFRDLIEAQDRLEEVLEPYHAGLDRYCLIRKGDFTSQAGHALDGQIDKARAMVLLMEKLLRAAHAMLGSDNGRISIDHEDLVQMFFSKLPPEVPLNSRQALTYARNQFRQHLLDRAKKKKRQGVAVTFDPALHGSLDTSHDEALYQRELTDLYAQASEQVCSRHPRDPMLKQFLREYAEDNGSLPELARKHGIKESTARSRFAEAAAIVRERMGA